ncbi:MAG: aldehyde-activating protein [Rhodobacterales bacterium]|nr:MAG: aldehyde-activating protein [Rhodobacterales bacterium]
MTALDGQCMCGAVSFQATPTGDFPAGVCHCSMCRRWSGGMFISVSCGDSVSIAEGAPLNVFDSSEWGQRVSCAKCGSSLIWRSKDGKQNQVSIQCFDDPGQFAVGMEIFVDDKPGCYDLANSTQKLTGAEVIAMFSGEGGQ